MLLGLLRRNKTFSCLHVIVYELIALVNPRSVLLFSGNPGFATVYVPFVKALYSAINRRFPVWVISHAGQVVAPKDKKILETPDGMSLYAPASLYSECMPTSLESPRRLKAARHQWEPLLVALAQGATFWGF